MICPIRTSLARKSRILIKEEFIIEKYITIKNFKFKVEIEAEEFDGMCWHGNVSSRGLHRRLGCLTFYREESDKEIDLIGDCGTTSIKVIRAVIQEGIKMAAKLNLDAVSFFTSDCEVSRENLYYVLARKHGGERGLSDSGDFIIPLREGIKIKHDELCQHLKECGCGQSEWPKTLCKNGEEISVFMKNGRWKR